MASKNYTVHEDGSITFHEGVEITETIRRNAEKAAAEALGRDTEVVEREKASDVTDDVEVRETAEGKTEREKADQ